MVRVGKINRRGGQEFRLACCVATSTEVAWSKRHGWTVILVDRLDNLVRCSGLELQGKRPTQRTLERALVAHRRTLRRSLKRLEAAHQIRNCGAARLELA